MSSILAIDTSSPQGSVGISTSDGSEFFRWGDEGETYSSRLFRWLKQIEQESDMDHGFSGLTAIAITSGPGTFTGLRVGIAAAKGIALSTKAQLLGFPTLEVMARAYSLEAGDCHICPLLNAGRGELYTARFVAENQQVSRLTDDEIVSPESLTEMDVKTPACFVGNGTDLLKEDIKSELSGTAKIDTRYLNLSRALLRLAIEKQNSRSSDDGNILEIKYIRKATS